MHVIYESLDQMVALPCYISKCLNYLVLTLFHLINLTHCFHSKLVEMVMSIQMNIISLACFFIYSTFIKRLFLLHLGSPTCSQVNTKYSMPINVHKFDPTFPMLVPRFPRAVYVFQASTNVPQYFLFFLCLFINMGLLVVIVL